MRKVIAILSLLTISSSAFASIDQEQICKEYVALAQTLTVAPTTKTFLYCQDLVKTKFTELKIQAELKALLLSSSNVTAQFAPYQGGGSQPIQVKSIRIESLNCSIVDSSKATCTADINESCSAGVERIEFRDLLFGQSPLLLPEVVGFKADCGSFN